MKRLVLLALIVVFPAFILRPDWLNSIYNRLADAYWDKVY